MFFSFIWLLWKFCPNYACIFDKVSGLFCINELFNHYDLLIPDVGLLTGIYLLNLTQPVQFQISQKDPDFQYTKFDSFIVEHSCVMSISAGFFESLGPLKMIYLNNVFCLKHLLSESFEGLKKNLETLKLITPDLEDIEDDLFEYLSSLKTLVISKSKLKALPPETFISTKLISVHLTWNDLEILPTYPSDTIGFVKDFSTEGNKWICDCRFHLYFSNIEDKRFFKSRCYNPPQLRGVTFCDVGDLCSNETFKFKKIERKTTLCHTSTIPTSTNITGIIYSNETTSNINRLIPKNSSETNSMTSLGMVKEKDPFTFQSVHSSVRWIVAYVLLVVTCVVLFAGISLVIYGFLISRNKVSNNNKYISDETIYEELFV